MINYETLMLARTEITEDELNALERQIDVMVASKKGKMTLFDRWGKYKLAYPVKKNLYGIYVLTRYKVPVDQVESFFKELDTLFRIKYNELIMRHVVVKLADDVSSVYKYPEPLSSHRSSNLDSFIKENKMKGLIDTPAESGEKTEELKNELPSEEPSEPAEVPAEEVVEEKTEELSVGSDEEADEQSSTGEN